MADKFSLRLILRFFSFILLGAILLGVIFADRPGNRGSRESLQPRSLAPGPVGSTPGSVDPTGVGSEPQASSEPIIGQAAMMDVSRPLSEIPSAPFEPVTGIREMGLPGEVDWLGQSLARQQIEDPVLQSSFSGNLMVEAQAQMPTPIQNFAGIDNISGVYPPDPNGDVGINHYVQMVNLSFQIWDKSGKSLLGPLASNMIWSGFGGPCATSNDGDPIVLYDQLADRWIMSQFVASGPFGECVAVSTSGNPTGSYYRYFFQFSASVMYDYPKLGVWPDGYYLTANRFNSTYPYGYLGASAIVLERSKMLAGQPARFIEYKTSTAYGSLLPSDLDGSSLPPANSPNFFLALNSTTLQIWKFKPNWITPGSSAFNGPASIPVSPFNTLCQGTRSCIDQPDTSVKLDGIGDRLMHRLVYRNFGDHEMLLVSHSVNAAVTGTKAGVRWYEIRTPNNTPVIYQQGTYAPDAAHRWMPSTAMDRIGNIAIVYSVSSSSIYPGIRYAGRLESDPLGQLAQAESSLIAGSGSQTGSASRWGDYAMISVDPVDGCTFWMTSEHMPITGTAPWKTQIGSFAYPGCLEQGSLTGVIRDKVTNRPLTGAMVEAKPSGGALPLYQVVSNEAGEYLFDYLPAGTYTIKASLLFYNPDQIAGVSVQIGVTSKQDLALQPDPATIFAPYFSKNYLR